jgi:hypothetical protein
MSYCGPVWTSPYTYTGIKNAILSAQAAMHPARAGNRAADREHLYLNFRVHTARDGKIDLLPTYILYGPGPGAGTGRETPVWLRLIDADDEVIRVHHCHFANPHHQADAATFDVHEAVPWDPATRSIEFLLDGKVINRAEVEAEDPRLTVHPPERMEAEPERMRVKWDARHSKTVWYMVRYTHDGGQTWHAVDADLTSPGLVVDLDLLPGGDQCAFQIVASSGLRTVTAETEPFAVKRKPRTVTILRPKTGEQFTQGASVCLLGVGHSPDFETAYFEDVMWTSNRDGYLGIGDQLTTHTLSPGRHRISVSVPDGLSGEASATVSIQIRN